MSEGALVRPIVELSELELFEGMGLVVDGKPGRPDHPAQPTIDLVGTFVRDVDQWVFPFVA